MGNKILKGNFRNYDVRGKYPEEIDESTASALGSAFLELTKSRNVVVACDNRLSSPSLKAALVESLLQSGADVTDIGMTTTDALYFASWKYGYDGGIMITASHIPGPYNGFKMLRADFSPISAGSGMEELFEIASKGEFRLSHTKGTLTERDIWNDYSNFVRSFLKVEQLKRFKVVMDAGNGMGGVVANHIFAGMNLDIVKLCFEPDGNFPNHDANPIIPENRVHIMETVKEIKADFGVAWDADADRVYFIDENGEFIHGDFITALLGIYFLKKHPRAGVVYDLRASDVVPDTLKKHGGRAYRERVGHAFIKRRMRQEDAIFGGEVSGHYYYRQNQYMDNGFIAVMILLEILSVNGGTLSELIRSLGDYYVSGEINSKVKDVNQVIQRIAKKYSDAIIDYVDGISVRYSRWHCNVRPSANDPVIRLNLEASSTSLMEEKRDEVLGVIREV